MMKRTPTTDKEVLANISPEYQRWLQAQHRAGVDLSQYMISPRAQRLILQEN